MANSRSGAGNTQDDFHTVIPDSKEVTQDYQGHDKKWHQLERAPTGTRWDNLRL